MKRCLIITGGKLDLSFAGSFLGQETFDKIIAVDAGLEAVKALGLEPDMIVGDFVSPRRSSDVECLCKHLILQL